MPNKITALYTPNPAFRTRRMFLCLVYLISFFTFAAEKGNMFNMTPIQTLTFYNAIANGGKMVKPSLRLGETEVINEQIASKENIAEIQKALYHVVTEGLAKPAGTPLVPVAGKTGTVLVNSYYQYSEYHISFCGYFPAFAPKYSIIVSLNKPGYPASGPLMAGSVFHDIVEWMVNHGWME